MIFEKLCKFSKFGIGHISRIGPILGIALKLAFSRAEIESALAHRFGSAFKLREKPAAEVMSTGIPEVDRIASGFPRGAITEILGPASSGRTSLLHSALATSTTR